MAEAATTAAVYGAGGLFGIAYGLGVTEALADAGVALSTVPALGTSAGSWVAVAVAQGRRFDDAIDTFGHRAPRWPDPRRGVLRRLAADVFGEGSGPDTVRAVACAIPRLRRVALSAALHPVADVVAASSSVPGLLAPHTVDGVRYVDGVVCSMVSVDLAPAADHLIVVVPLGGAVLARASWMLRARHRAEVAAWRARNPRSRIMVFEPGASLARIVRRPDQLFDPRSARVVHELAYDDARRRLEELTTVRSYGHEPPMP